MDRPILHRTLSSRQTSRHCSPSRILLSQNLALTQDNLNAQKTNWEDQLGVLQGNLVSNIDSLGDMSEQIGAQYGVVDDARKAAGYKTDKMAGLTETTDNYSRTELEDLYTAAGLDPCHHAGG